MANALHLHLVVADGSESAAQAWINGTVADAGRVLVGSPLLHYADADTGTITYHGWKLSLTATEYNRLTAGADAAGVKHETLATYDGTGERIAPATPPNMLGELNIIRSDTE